MTDLRKMDRREFLRATGYVGGSLILGASMARWAAEALAQEPVLFEPNVFLSVDRDGWATVVVSRSEMGQGTRTGMPMILAEELEMPLDRVRIVQADGDEKYGPQLTGGSLSVRQMWDPLRRAGASARTMLIAAAAARWEVSAADCEAEDGTVHHRGSGRSLGYGELVDEAAALPVPDEESLELKSSDRYRLVGTRAERIDAPDIVTGRTKFGLDTRLPGMRYAAIARCPIYGGGVAAYDADAALAVAGVSEVIPVPAPERSRVRPGVAVIAADTWSAFRGVRALAPTWDAGDDAGESTQTLADRFTELAAGTGETIRNEGDVEAAFADAAQIFESTYDLPFLAHAPMEPLNCTVHVQGETCEIWTPTQNPQTVQVWVANVLQIPKESVIVHVVLAGGGFGRRLYPDAEVEAALLAREIDGPVQVVWTREDDIQHDLYRPSSRHLMRAGFDGDGQLVAWNWHILNTTPGRFDPNDFPAYHFPNYRAQYTHVPWILPRGAWRSTVNSQNPLVTQGFFDELAVQTGRDPLEWRLQLLRDSDRPEGGEDAYSKARMVGVVEEVARKANWGSELPEGVGRGFACYFGYGSYAAQVAEVRATGDELKVERVVCALDCGQVVNPDLVEAQIEGATAFGISAAMMQAITVEGGRVAEGNFNDFPTLRAGEMPRIESHIIANDERPGGVGETPLPPAGPALINAIFDATGKRVKRLPVSTQV